MLSTIDKKAVRSSFAAHNVTCKSVNESFDREVARCSGEGKDLGKAMVYAGYALTLRNFITKYIAYE